MDKTYPHHLSGSAMAGNDTESGSNEGKEVGEEEDDDVSLQSRCPYLHLVRLQLVPLHVHCHLHDLPGRGKCLPPRPVQETTNAYRPCPRLLSSPIHANADSQPECQRFA